ncbi:type I 3-dehydroquinate dehydratase [Loigolactobacillus coryniformis]|nr:type I 3-dehydroquinate dehydratase [Loigolactobacillus coryniformis]MCL5459565.1 type I 3-dehydroquinate dehydratase [Loigolactobacillus coryniformis]
MTVVKLKKVELGSGQPKIAVPITGEDQTSVLVQAKQIVAAQPDVIEWRLDYYQDILNTANYRSTATALIKLLGDIPLLTTFRTKKEGGEMALNNNDYFKIYQQVIDSHLTDALDIELFLPNKLVKDLIVLAQDADIAVVISNHDFNKTPAQDVIVERLNKMAALGGDIAKIAVMPNSASDVVTLLKATTIARQELSIPVITMAMGDLGKVSRISGEVFGSALTFGTVGASSAPGQIELTALRRELSELTLAK